MDRNQATRFGRAIHAALQDPVKLGGIDVDVSGSLGLAFADGYTTDAAKLLRQADMAMYAAKERGRPSMLFDPSHEVSTPARLARLTRLRQAISAGELEVHFQPKLRLSDGAVCGVEALARWCDSDLGWVSPDEFIPLAERAGLIRPLTDLVLRQSLAACSRWQSVAPGIGVAVNISARSMFDRGIAEQIARLREFSPAVGLLTLEITESSVMTDPGSTVELLRQLHTLGVRLAIDDFGTGYSSLSYLQRLPVDEIKVDKAFVQGVDENAEDAAIVRAVVELGHALGLTVVAEGVERPETLDQLRNLGCDQIQGYLISRPVPEASLVDWLHRRLPRLRVAQGA
jgi:EAL domain-containing protein (putative c-di-GMP-specific phosphodiesterase class I)